MDFGNALQNLKAGYRVARQGWNGKDMWIVLVNGSNGTIPMRPNSSYANAGLTDVKIDSHIDMMTANGSMQPGWLASQADMLADDWSVMEALTPR
ncbi:MAG: DUF2829 domain-containing protein [Gammaproteobacteria bacterium]|nr:DUF2829 domain-containing protein [Gammaproteobacteria bacterium]